VNVMAIVYKSTFLHLCESSSADRRARSEEPVSRGSGTVVEQYLEAAWQRAALPPAHFAQEIRTEDKTQDSASTCGSDEIAGHTGSHATTPTHASPRLSWCDISEEELTRDAPVESQSNTETAEQQETTLMLRNVPNGAREDEVVWFLFCNGFTGAFDILYLPRDSRSGCNRGYAFINFHTPELYQIALKVLGGQTFTSRWSNKVTATCPAAVQGRAALLEANQDRMHCLLVMP